MRSVWSRRDALHALTWSCAAAFFHRASAAQASNAEPPDAPDLPEEVLGIAIPDSALARKAAAAAHAASPLFLFNHGMRTFVLASVVAARQDWVYDAELVFIASAFHDIGLTEPLHDPTKSFEEAGADAARSFLAGQSVAPDRIELVWQAIRLHTRPGTSANQVPTIGMVQVGAGMDAFGFDLDQIQREERDAIAEAFPRADFKNAFKELLAAYATRNPVHAGWTKAFLCTTDCSGLPVALQSSPWPE